MSGKAITKPKKNIFTFLEKYQNILPPFILTIITTLFYWPSLNYPFQFDDLANITKKFAIRNDNPLTRIFTNARWMADWLNRINYQMGRFNPFYYRLFNLIIHITAGVLLFYLILTLLKKLDKDNFLFKNSLLIAFTTSGLFLLHPVQTQTISYVIQARLEGLASMFIIAILLVMVNALASKNIISKSILFSLAVILSVLGGGTKEIIIVTPILLALCDWFFLSNSDWNKFKNRVFYHLGFALFFYLFFFSRYMSFNFFTRAVSLKMVTANNRGNILTTNAQNVIKPIEFLISEFKVILHYLLMFIWPFNISVEYDWKLSPSFFSADSFFPFLILLFIFSAALYTTIKKKNTFIGFGLFWFFITIAPRTTLVPSPELVCDYKTYLASIGWIFILATSIVYLIKYVINTLKSNTLLKKSVISQLAILTILLLPIGTGAYFRNTVWRTAVEFWGDIVKKAPLKARGHNNYGVSLSEANQIDKAIKHYKRAIALDKYYSDPLSNIAVAYSMKNQLDEAINALQMALSINRNYPEAYNNIGTLLLKKKDYENAEKAFDNAIKLRPYYGKAFYNKARLYIEKGDKQTAWTYFKKATEGDLDTPEGFYTLGQMSINLQKYDEAVKAFKQIIKLGAKNPEVYFNLANSYYMLKEYDKAQNIYQALVKSNPQDSRYLYNLAETFFTKNQIEEALQLYKKITKMPKSLAQAHLKIAVCLERLKKYEEADKYLNLLLKAKASDQFKQAVRNQKTQLELQRKVANGNGSIKMSELKKILAKTKSQDKKEA
ncbi:tetratricopeptide repeat protein [Candidatus Dependentiae bacterium]|nr:tetratricopeptide repeat protein [Candidatus Dependentiae bacterium]